MGQRILWLMVAGALGTLARYGLTSLAHRTVGRDFPLGTLIVNLTGCFCIGLIWQWAEHRLTMNTEWKLIVMVGFLGAFTTFSAYAFETIRLVQHNQWGLAAANICAQNILGLAAVVAGHALGKWT